MMYTFFSLALYIFFSTFWEIMIFDFLVQVWQFGPLFTDQGHAGCVKSISSNGRFLATGSTDETIRWININTYSCLILLISNSSYTFKNDAFILVLLRNSIQYNKWDKKTKFYTLIDGLIFNFNFLGCLTWRSMLRLEL